MLDFCGEHNITADVEIIPIPKINEAYERMVRSDVKYRFSIDIVTQGEVRSFTRIRRTYENTQTWQK
jgi:hypothetical protein